MLVFDRIIQWNHLGLKFLCMKAFDNKFNFLESPMSYFTSCQFSFSCVFQGVSPCHLIYQIFQNKVAYDSPYYLLHVCRRYRDSPFFLRNIDNLYFPLFFLISLARSSSVLSIFSKNQLLTLFFVYFLFRWFLPLIITSHICLS